MGDSCTGKSSIFERYIRNTFNDDTNSTIGGSYASKKIMIGDKLTSINLWDTAGQERFRSMVKIYYRGTNGCFIVFDVCNRDSFNHLDTWFTELYNDKNINNTEIIIVGNKCDIIDNRVVSTEEALLYAQNKHVEYFEVSAKSGNGINEMFDTMISNIANNVNSKKIHLLNNEKSNLKSDYQKTSWKLFGYC